MTHLSPAIFAMWSVSSVLLTAFCFHHIWHYDRFRCLLTNHGPYSGAFKRLMTYTYVLTLPMITIYSVGNAVIKYQEGFVSTADFGVVPKPYAQWTKAHQDATFPLLMFFAIGFGLEMTTHLEELCFWMFLMNATASSQDWFRSAYFGIWACGSLAALVCVPVTAAIFRNNPLQSEAYTFLVGSIGSLALTIFFVPTLYSFPEFMRNLVKHGVDKPTIMRLMKFYELNRLRIFFRLLFVLPLVILGIDGVRPHDHPINQSMFWTDLFGVTAAFGCIVSSAITLLIFFPRSEENEYESSSFAHLGNTEASQRKDQQKARDYPTERNHPGATSQISIGSPSIPQASIKSPLSFAPRFALEDEDYPLGKCQSPNLQSSEPGRNADHGSSTSVVSGAPLRPNRLGPNGDVELGNVQDLPTGGEWVSSWTSRFRSPLDVVQLGRAF